MCDKGMADGECRADETDAPQTLPDERELSGELDTVFELLGDRERRSVVAHLLEGNGQTATVPELADQCQQEAEGSTSTTDPVVMRLHHTHLPKLEDAGVVEYDPRSKTVRYRGDALLETFLGQVSVKEHR